MDIAIPPISDPLGNESRQSAEELIDKSLKLKLGI